MRQGLRLAHEDFLCHLRDGLISLHAVLLPKGLIPPRRSMGVACGLGSLLRFFTGLDVQLIDDLAVGHHVALSR
jgi:hypothetical protein